MKAVLTIVGALLEAAGLVLVFVELAELRRHEFETPLPRWLTWSREAWRRVLRRPQVIPPGRLLVEVRKPTLAVTVERIPRPLARDATDPERIEWLLWHIQQLELDVRRLAEADHERHLAAIEGARKLDQARQDEFEQQEGLRRQVLVGPSIRRQWLGTGLVIAGLAISTAGNVM